MEKRMDKLAVLPEQPETILPTDSTVNFKISIAGQTIAVRAMHDTTRLFCRDYLSEEAADFSVAVTEEDIAFEQAKNAQPELDTGRVSDAYLETIALLRKVSEKLIAYNTLLFHGSVVAVDGAGYLFTAPSGTGKSTHTRLWRQMLGDKAVMINDDKPFLRITKDCVLAYGSPWNGKHRLDTNTNVVLKAICILERGKENHIRQIPAREALPALFEQSHRPNDPKQMPRYMDLLDALAKDVTFFHMNCNVDPEAARMSYQAMAGAENLSPVP